MPVLSNRFTRHLAWSALLVPLVIVTNSDLPAKAQGIEQLLTSKVPVPTPRPLNRGGGVPLNAAQPAQQAVAQPAQPAQPAQQASPASVAPVATAAAPRVSGIKGSLKDGLDALTSKDLNRARAIRYGMAAGSLDRKILAWAIALSGQNGVTSGEIAEIANDLPDWPGQKAMRKNAEEAMLREGAPANTVIAAFGNRKPESIEGAMVLAEAHLARGNRRAANAILAPFWHRNTLSASIEKRVLARAGRALTVKDHQTRMHRLFYRERVGDAMRMSSLAEQSSLAKARAAVIRNANNADSLIKSVAASSKRDPAYLYTRIKRLRRTGNHGDAAKLLLQAPRDRAALVHPDEWWIERRIVSREMLNRGDARTAYKLAAAHSAESPAKFAEAEFHAGWYALRFLNDKRTARRHFQAILKVTDGPISQARGNYWLGRASSGAQARKYYKAAAEYAGTYYGQLAAAKLGQRRLNITKPRPSASDRARFASREPVRAIKRLEELGYRWRADIIYRELAAELNDAGELAILSARAENRGNRTLALQIGKIANARGLQVDTLAWPIGAIPRSAKIGDTGLALAYSIARQESAFNVSAVSPANARGLLQLLPGTAKLMARKTGLPYSHKRLTTDPGYNATLGAAYLSEQLDNFGNSYILTFAGYNAGPGRSREWVEAYGNPTGKSIDEVVDWVERIPFTETRNYVQRVLENYQVYKARLSGSGLTIERDLRYGRR